MPFFYLLPPAFLDYYAGREDRDRNYGLTISISKYTFCLLHKNGTLASQYLRWMVFRARGQPSLGRIRAVPANSGPVILPRMVQGAIRTCGLLRMRLYFPESLRVITYSLPFSSPNQTGVCTTEPSFLEVPREVYFWPWISGGTAMKNIVRKRTQLPENS